jgi:Cys/Met metabolism PLP-dependent enzyme
MYRPAVLTFGLRGGYEAGVKLVSNVQLFSHLADIGYTRSLIIHPASTTHRQLTDAQKIAAGAGPDVVRLSMGKRRQSRHHRRPRTGAGGLARRRCEPAGPARSGRPDDKLRAAIQRMVQSMDCFVASLAALTPMFQFSR